MNQHSSPSAWFIAKFFFYFLVGFARKEFRGKLAIAITANFVNRNTTAEAKVEEISGVAFIFNQKFFLELKEETGEVGKTNGASSLFFKTRPSLFELYAVQ